MAAEQPKKNDKQKGPNDEGISWQAQKSAMTRDRILEAAIDCFIDLGYTNVTTAKVADFAGYRAARCCITFHPRPNSSKLPLNFYTTSYSTTSPTKSR
ncbi:TetR/AcrR family transcriptional regulator [Oceanicoccus sp. KOV_DT_Chl]|uniref:TetR/AcrR family transcriptional regulator n=1 Tax=Oceanicoccus sp. KOV_DT_Chl TaxID=1904639 RepID=UPI000C7A38A0|nr:TetR/AcrR family transcriptional regulator [Oceanicoccus sp. KOV_DT_Chl]